MRLFCESKFVKVLFVFIVLLSCFYVSKQAVNDFGGTVSPCLAVFLIINLLSFFWDLMVALQSFFRHLQ